MIVEMYDTKETTSNNNVPSINSSNYKEIEEYKRRSNKYGI